MFHHKRLLSSLCRVCGETIDKEIKPYQDKKNFASDIAKLYDINVETEKDSIYPRNICKRHTDLFYRYRQSVQHNKAFISTVTNICKFSPHNESCRICYIVIDNCGHDYVAVTPKSKRRAKKKRKVTWRTGEASVLVEPPCDSSSDSDSYDTKHDDNCEELPLPDSDEAARGADRKLDHINTRSNAAGCSDNAPQPKHSEAQMKNDDIFSHLGAGSNTTGVQVPSTSTCLLQTDKCAIPDQPSMSTMSSFSSVSSDRASTVFKMYTDLDDDDRKTFTREFVYSLSSSEELFLAQLLGKQQATNIKTEAKAISTYHKDISDLIDLDLNSYTHSQNRVVHSFLAGITQIDQPSDKQLYILGRTVEQIYKIVFPKAIAPLSFINNVCAYMDTGSKAVIDSNGSMSPAGKYKSLSTWLNNQAAAGPPKPPDGDIICAFDNNQVLGKRWQVTPFGQHQASVITNKMYVQLDEKGSLEKREDLKPEKWLFTKDTNIVTNVMNEEETPEFNTTHWIETHALLNAAIKDVVQELGETGRDYIDAIVTARRQDDFKKKCQYCNMYIAKSKKKCSFCGKMFPKIPLRKGNIHSDEPVDQIVDQPRMMSSKPKTSISMYTRHLGEDAKEKATPKEQYSHVPSSHSADPPTIQVADPVFVNPNSYDNVKEVLREVGAECGITRYKASDSDEAREWIPVVCDGSPLSLIQNIIHECVVCGLCKGLFPTQDKLIAHFKSTHQQEFEEDNMPFAREFDWLLPRIGNGHYEMNMVKSFFEINWIPCMKALCFIMGFTSESALSSAKRCADHHKAWLLLNIFHIGTLKELVRPFVLQCNAKKETPTVMRFMDFVHYGKDKMKDKCYLYYLEMVLRYSLAIISLRAGVRRNNAQLVKTAKNKFKELIHSRNHPKYQIIEIYETLIYAQAPEEVKAFMDSHVSASRSGNPSLGEDMDFLLEKENRRVKKLLPPGLPTDVKWEAVCRNVSDLHMLRESHNHLLGVEKTPASSHERDISAGVAQWRSVLREEKLLAREDMVSINGDPLADELADMTELGAKKRKDRFEVMFLKKDLPSTLSLPVCVTVTEKEDQAKLCNKTVNMLQADISEMISSVNEEEQRRLFLQDYRKCKNKPSFIALHEKLTEYFENEDSGETNDNNCDDEDDDDDNQ